MNELVMPKVGNTYDCFDDGKVKESRKYRVTIDCIVSFDCVDSKTLKEWEEMSTECDWLFAKKTDYFIFANSDQDGQEEQEVFARTTGGGWFGLGKWFGMGALDVDGSKWKTHLEAVEKYLKK